MISLALAFFLTFSPVDDGGYTLDVGPFLLLAVATWEMGGDKE